MDLLAVPGDLRYGDRTSMARQSELFTRAAVPPKAAPHAPLAERMRPRTIEEFVGQRHLLGEGRLLHELLRAGSLESLILWGPPGTGKTTLARLLADASGRRALHFSAVLQGVKELRELIAEAKREVATSGHAPVLFVDEIHRFNKSQQDAFLPHVEAGTIVLIGATTENPSFEIVAPLLSRTRVLVLEPLADTDIELLLERALADPERGLGRLAHTHAEDGRRVLVAFAQGDARIGLGLLEVAARLAHNAGARTIDAARVEEAAQHRAPRYDKAGEEHYNVISAFIKSLRGSDPDAAVYWLMRMLEAGEDPLFVARRMVIFAAEDVGNAAPEALGLAVAAKDAVHFVGMPEGRIPLAQVATFLATAPKSNASYRAMLAAADEVRASGALPVPLHLRNAPTPLMKDLGYGREYRYPHDAPDAVGTQQYLPEHLGGRRFYEPTERGFEQTIRERLQAWRAKRSGS